MAKTIRDYTETTLPAIGDNILLSRLVGGSEQYFRFDPANSNPGFACVRTSTVSVGSGVAQNFLGDSVLFQNPSGWYVSGTGRFTPLVAGWYGYYSQGGFSGANDGVAITCIIRKNGSALTQESFSIKTGSSGGAFSQLFYPFYMNGSSDYVEALYSHNDVGNLNLGAAGLFVGMLLFPSTS